MIEPFDSEAGYRAAIDATIEAAQREVCLFGGDLERMALDEAGRSELLLRFLAADQNRRLRMVVHDPAPLQARHPRLLNIIRTHGHKIEVRQTPDHLRHLADRFVLAAEAYGAIRFHADHPRGKRIAADPKEAHPYWQRFDDLWLECQVCTPSTAGI